MPTTHLVLILDLAPTPRLHPTLIKYPSELDHWLNSVIAFGIAHLSLNERNGLTVFASHFGINECAYTHQPREAVLCSDGQHGKFAAITEEISRRLYSLITEASSKLEASRADKDAKTSEPAVSAALASALCFINKKKGEFDRSRVAIISPNIDDTYSLTSQYMIFMNCFFTAQKLDVPIDVATCTKATATDKQDTSINGKEEIVNSILRQGCDITCGIYLPILNLKSLLQYLMVNISTLHTPSIFAFCSSFSLSLHPLPPLSLSLSLFILTNYPLFSSGLCYLMFRLARVSFYQKKLPLDRKQPVFAIEQCWTSDTFALFACQFFVPSVLFARHAKLLAGSLCCPRHPRIIVNRLPRKTDGNVYCAPRHPGTSAVHRKQRAARGSPFSLQRGRLRYSQMLPKPDFSSLDKKDRSISSECTVNKNTPLITETFRCTPCAQVFANAADLAIHKEEHIPCGFAGCEFEANYKVLLDHQTSVHMNLKKTKSTHSVESAEDIEKWRAERRRKFPKLVNTQKEVKKEEEKESKQIEPVNSNECLDKSTSVSSGLPTDVHDLQSTSATSTDKECETNSVNDSCAKAGGEESCSSRKRGPISTYGAAVQEQESNKFSKKKRRNQRKKHRNNQHATGTDETNDVRWQSNTTADGKSGGNFGATLTTKGTSASSFRQQERRRPTLFEKLMQSSAVESQSKDGDNE